MNKQTAGVGLFHPSRPSYSKETQQVLKVLMDETKLSNLQRKRVNTCLRDGAPLPASLNKSNKQLKPAPQLKHLNPTNYKSNRRSQAQILSAQSYLRDQYQPTPFTKYGGSYEQEKLRLGSLMAYGEDLRRKAQEEAMKKGKKMKEEEISQKHTYTRVEKDRFHEIQNEITEREDFLTKMEKFGQSSEHKNRIDSEISQLITEMELIDKRKNEEAKEYRRNK